MHCPICDKKIEDENLEYCPYCKGELPKTKLAKTEDNKNIDNRKQEEKEGKLILILSILTILFCIIPLGFVLSIIDLKRCEKFKIKYQRELYGDTKIANTIAKVTMIINILFTVLYLSVIFLFSCTSCCTYSSLKNINTQSSINIEESINSDTIDSHEESIIKNELNEKYKEIEENMK